jgi:hypothetical protein
MRNQEPLNLPGFFWLPSDPDNKLPGTLVISVSDEINLEVLGTFQQEQPEEGQSQKPMLVAGITERGPVTLTDCFIKSQTQGQITKSSIIVNFAFIGFAFEIPNHITFDEFIFTVEGLDEWLSITTYTVEREERTTKISYALPEPIKLRLNEELELAFSFVSTLPFKHRPTGPSITQKAFVKITPPSPKPLDYFLNVSSKLNNFLCFAIDQIVTVESAIGISPNATRELVGGKIYKPRIEIYYKSIPRLEMKPDISWHRMLFRYQHVANDLEEVMRRWFGGYEICEPAFKLYFSSIGGAYRYLEGRFLSLAQGIETLHRRTSDRTLLKEADFKTLIKTIRDGCPQEHLQWLNDRLWHGNELPLRERLAEMIEPFQKVYGPEKEIKALINQILDTRNYLTHYDEKPEKKSAKGFDLYPLILKLELLFQLHFLRMIGFDSERIEALSKENNFIKSKLGIDES